MVNGYAAELTIEREDNDKDYEPGNCRWATLAEQANNQRRSRLLTSWGETKTFAQWLKDPRCLASRGALQYRLSKGMSPEEALTQPPKSGGYNQD